MRNDAERRIGHLYPKLKLPKEEGGSATVIAWLWARTVRCPNPACGARMCKTGENEQAFRRTVAPQGTVIGAIRGWGRCNGSTGSPV